MSSYRFSRRSLLASAGLAGAFVPLLDARRGFAEPKLPRRLVILQWTNGIINKDYWPTGGEHDFVLGKTLEPLEPHRKDVIVVGKVGLRNQVESKAAGVGVGHQSLWALLTGSHAAQGRNGGGPCGIASSISVDQYVAKALAGREATKFPSLEVGGLGLSAADNERAISFRGPAVGGRPAENVPEIDPNKLWSRLFKDGVPATDMPAVSEAQLARLRLERKSVLDVARGELAALAKRVGRADAMKLDQHLASMRQLETELTELGAGSPGSGCVAPAAPPAAGNPPWWKDGGQIDKLVPLQMDLILAALRCNLTRVVTYMMFGCANDHVRYSFLGPQFPKETKYLSGDHHGIAHSAGDNPETENGKMKVLIDQWWMKQFASFIGKLRATPEGAGTMLDNTLVVMANHMNTGAGHGTGGGVPFLLAGSCQGYFKTGRYVATASDKTPHNGILVAIANAMLNGQQDPLTHFGDPQYGGELPGLRG